MTITCNHLDDLLFDGSPLAMETAARHAETCAACAERLADWNDISATAQSMRETWQNDMLWPRIERSLRAERRSSGRRLWQVAAALFLIFTLGGTMYYALRVQTHDAAFDQDILRISALGTVACRGHRQTRARRRRETRKQRVAGHGLLQRKTDAAR